MAASQRNSKTASAQPDSQKQSSRTKKADTGKRTAKNTSKRRTKNASGRNTKEKYSDALMLICVTASMIFVACCNIGLCGVVGIGVRSIFFGLFGILQYILPFAIIFAAFAMVADQYSSYVIRKITLSVVMVILLCAFAHMIVHIDWGFEQLGMSFVYSKEHKSAGGIIGALVTSIFYPLLDKSGTYLLIILAIIILFLLIAGDYVFDLFRSFSIYFKEDEEEMIARENYQARREERLRMKQEMRKNARKQYYQEAAQKEDDALDKLRKKRMERMHMNTTNTMQTYQIAPNNNKPEASKKQEKAVLTDEGFAVSDKPKQEKIEASKDSTKMRKAAKAPEEDKANVQIAENGELKITGIFEETVENEAKPKDNENHLMQDEGFLDNADSKIPRNATIVETTAHFVDEEDLEEIVLEPEVVVPPKASRRKTKETREETIQETANTQKEVEQAREVSDNHNYEKPLLELLARGSRTNGSSKAELQATAKKLEETLDSFGVHVTVTNVSCGPAVTRYEMLPEQGTRVSKITGLTDDIKLNLAVPDIRIEAPIPGKSAIGIEVPNKSASAVSFRDLLEESDFFSQESDLSFAAGKDIGGNVVISDIAKMPHVLIAGATGSGKSVCINTLIMSLLYKAHPDDVKLIMIDPKVVELSVYNGIPHLLIPVVTDPKKASGALNWAVAEMKARYDKFAEYNVRNLEGYNSKVEKLTKDGNNPDGEIEKMPKIVIIVDELADLMMVAHGEVEDAIVRLSQLARAAGIHLVIATQRPSVDVITGLIKANVPSRIAFAVSSGVDSRTILDMNGAEKLLGKGDMLFAPSGYPKPVRVQGAFVSDKEVSKVVEFLKAQNLKVQYNDNITKEINCGPQSVRDANKEQDRDEYFVDAGRFIIEKEKASIGMLQRVYKIGFNRAARIMDQLSEAGVVGPEEGTKPRQILMSMEQFENMLEEGL